MFHTVLRRFKDRQYQTKNAESHVSNVSRPSVKVGDEDLFKNTYRVSIELSNRCNYAKIHKKCPLNLVDEPIILPAKIVFDILDTLDRYNFQGEIAFHNYNEPLIDPRLFKFIEYARQGFPQREIYICTNGFYLNQTLLDELVESGVSNVRVSAYSKREYQRLSQIKAQIPLSVEMTSLDDRLKLYESKEKRPGNRALRPSMRLLLPERRVSVCAALIGDAITLLATLESKPLRRSCEVENFMQYMKG